MKKLIAFVLAAMLCIGMAAMCFAEELDFSGNADEEAYAETEEGIFEVYPNKHTFIKGNLEAGMSFGFKSSFRDHDWLNINLNNDNYFPETNNGYLGNKGVTLLVQMSDASVKGRFVTNETNWDAPYAEFNVTDEEQDMFGNGEWHKIAVGKVDGKWSITINGNELLAGITDEQNAVLDDLLGGGTGNISFGSTTGQGFYYICSGEVADAKIALQTVTSADTEAPITFAPEPTVDTEKGADDTTAAPASTTEAGNGENTGDDASNSNLIIYIIAGVVAVAAIVVIVVLIAKKKK